MRNYLPAENDKAMMRQTAASSHAEVLDGSLTGLALHTH